MINTKKTISTLLLILMMNIAIAQKNGKKPNIIIILSDDAGYADFECYGKNEIPTPHINQLAKEGTLFSRGYVSASVCAPSRAGLLTGRYQQRFGFENNPTGKPAPGYSEQDMGVDLNEKTIANRMKEEGYSTIGIGKWHLGNEDKFFPLQRGFDEFYGFREGHRDFFSYKEARDLNHALWDNDRVVPEEEITYLTDMFTAKALHFIKQKAEEDKPFFMYLAYNCVHTPLQAKQEDLDEFSHIQSEGRQTYDAMLLNMDKNIGKLMQSLKDNGIDENTLVFFLNDNGGATTNFSDNGELRGMKGSMWEGGTRVGFIMRWPGMVPANKVYDKPVISLDILPTCLWASGNNQTSEKPLDGVNLFNYINHSQKTPHEYLYWKRGIAAAIQSHDWKLIRVDTAEPLLFHLGIDKSEQINLAKAYPKKVEELLSALKQWESTLPPARWSGSFGPRNTIIKHQMTTRGREMERRYP